MEKDSIGYVALDTSKLRNAVAIAEEGRDGEVRYLGEIDNTAAATGEAGAQAGEAAFGGDVLL